MRDKWVSYKFDHVEMVRYDVLLSRPPRDKPNVVQILNVTDRSALWTVTGPEKVSDPLVVIRKNYDKLRSYHAKTNPEAKRYTYKSLFIALERGGRMILVVSPRGNGGGVRAEDSGFAR